MKHKLRYGRLSRYTCWVVNALRVGMHLGIVSDWKKPNYKRKMQRMISKRGILIYIFGQGKGVEVKQKKCPPTLLQQNVFTKSSMQVVSLTFGFLEINLVSECFFLSSIIISVKFARSPSESESVKNGHGLQWNKENKHPPKLAKKIIQDI